MLIGLFPTKRKRPISKRTETMIVFTKSIQSTAHYSDLMGISFLILCSKEIKVSVAVTPGIS